MSDQRLSVRRVTINCPECHYDVGVLQPEGTAICDRCDHEFALGRLRLEYLGFGKNFSPVIGTRQSGSSIDRWESGQLSDPKKRPSYNGFASGALGKNKQQKDPQPLQFPRFNMRFSERTFNQINSLIRSRRMTAADIVRELIEKAYEEEQRRA